jgi:hypothetical protein
MEAYDAIAKEGYNSECFHVICKTKKEAIKALEESIKKNKKLNKDGTYYVYIGNAYEYAKYWKDTHFIFDYNIGDIKVIEGRIVPEHPFDKDDYFDIEYVESLSPKYINEYHPIPDDVMKMLDERMKSIEDGSADVIKLETPYDHIEKKDEVRANLASALDGGPFKPISIKISDEAIAKLEKHDAAFTKSGFWALQKYISDKSKEKK